MKKSISVLFSLLWILTLIAIPSSPQMTQAQSPMGGLCGKLSEENCAIITGSYTTMQSIASTQFSGTMTMDISGFDEAELMGMDGFGFNFALEGVGGGDFAPMYALQGNPAAVFEMFKDPEALVGFIEMYSQMLNSMKFQVTMTMSFSEELQPLMEMQGYGEIPFEIRMSDGVMYMYSDLLAEEGVSNWQGLDFSGMGESIRQSFEADFAGEELDAETLAMLELVFDSDYIKLLSDPTFYNQHVVVTRLEDQTSADGQTLAVFKTSYDYASMFSDPAMVAALQSFAEMMEELDSTTSSEELLAELDASFALYENMTYESIQWIGVDDLYVYHTETMVEMSIDPATLEGMEDSPLTESSEAIVYRIEMALDFSNYNAPIEIEIPENAEITDMGENMENSES